MFISSVALEKQQATYQKLSGMNISDLCVGLIPAFRDLSTDETHLSLSSDGQVSPIHLVEGLPLEWVREWDMKGYPKSLKPGIVAGFFRGEKFYTLEQLEHMNLDT